MSTKYSDCTQCVSFTLRGPAFDCNRQANPHLPADVDVRSPEFATIVAHGLNCNKRVLDCGF